MCPKLILEAESAVGRARNAAMHLGSSLQAELGSAETLLAAVRHFAYRVSDQEGPNGEDVGRLVSDILGYEVKVDSLSLDYKVAQGIAYSKLAR